jgi:hypothetical protein
MVVSYFSGRSSLKLGALLTRLKLAVKAWQPAPYRSLSLSEVVLLTVGKPDDTCSTVAWSRFPHALSRAVRASSLALSSLRWNRMLGVPPAQVLVVVNDNIDHQLLDK